MIPLDISKLPVAELKAIYDVLTGKRKLALDLIPALTRVIDWAYENWLSKSAESPVVIGTPEGMSDADVVLAFLDGNIVDDHSDAKGGIVGGLLASIAVNLLVKAAKKLLDELLDK